MRQVTVIAKVVAGKDVVEAVKAELVKLVAPTRQEKGCIEYKLHQDRTDPAVFVFYETWESEACLEEHTRSAHYRQYAGAVEGKVVEKTVHKMKLVD